MSTQSTKDLTNTGDTIKFDSDDSMFVRYGKVVRKNKNTLTVIDGESSEKVLVPYGNVAGWQ